VSLILCLSSHSKNINLTTSREMAVGNTFGATALSSYGGFWLSFAIILTPGGFEIESSLVKVSEATFLNSFGLYLMGWFIFTTILLICTLRSTVAFFFLFFTLDMAFLLLGIGYLQNNGKAPNSACITAGGAFGLLAAFTAWYNALAGIADSSNRLVLLPSTVPLASMINVVSTASSSFPSRTSPGPTRAARSARRSTTPRRASMQVTPHRSLQCNVSCSRVRFAVAATIGGSTCARHARRLLFYKYHTPTTFTRSMYLFILMKLFNT
jgi:succinate-acetate transporter protein